MNVTEVRINLNRGGKVKAFAQIVVDGCFLLGDIRILEGKEGAIYVAMPSRRLRNGSFREIARALNSETRRRLDEVILGEYHKVLEERGIGEDGNNGGSRAQQLAGRFLGEKYWTDEDAEEE
jgi:stage V sporulation protein G